MLRYYVFLYSLVYVTSTCSYTPVTEGCVPEEITAYSYLDTSTQDLTVFIHPPATETPNGTACHYGFHLVEQDITAEEYYKDPSQLTNLKVFNVIQDSTSPLVCKRTVNIDSYLTATSNEIKIFFIRIVRTLLTS